MPNNQVIRVNPDTVTFGIEIECNLPVATVRRIGLQRGGHGRGVQVPGLPQGWEAENDGSLKALPGYMSVEITSPVLCGLDGLHQVREVFAKLNEWGFKVNKSCGQHVHIGAKSLLGSAVHDGEFLAEFTRRLINLFSKHEFALLGITGRASRFGNYYCKSIKNDENAKFRKGVQFYQVDSYKTNVERYRTLNLKNLTTSYSGKNTIEFRVFGGTTNATKAIGYIITALGLCIKAATTPVAPTFDDCTLTPDSLQCKVKELHNALRWRKSNLARWESTGFQIGYPTGAYEEFAGDIRKNQLWNARQLERRLNGSLLGATDGAEN